MLIGFSARKTALTLYGAGYLGGFEDVLVRLGKVKTGKGCIYIKRMSNVDLYVLREFVTLQYKAAKALPEQIDTVSTWTERKKELGR
jgi:hypothetical protein